jgi:hypothetical protein
VAGVIDPSLPDTEVLRELNHERGRRQMRAEEAEEEKLRLESEENGEVEPLPDGDKVVLGGEGR